MIRYKKLPIYINKKFTGYGLKTPLVLLHIPDLHIGINFKKDEINEIIKSINNIDFDFIIFNGDFLEATTSNVEINELFKYLLISLKHKKVIFIEGNHEVILEKKNADIISTFNKYKTENHFFLKNETMKLEDIDIEGLSNHYSSKLKTSDYYKKNINKVSERNTIILSHDPNAYLGVNLERKNKTLIISGHTHGEQIKFSSFFLLNDYKYISGTNQLSDNVTLHIGNGAGYSARLPLRIFVPNQIELINLS